MDRVAVIASAMTQFGRREGWLRDLQSEAALACIDGAPLGPDDVEHLYVSNMAGGEFEGQTGLSNMLVHDIGAMPAYTARIDQTSASGGGGVHAAWQSVASGASECTLLVGVEKMTHRETSAASDVIASLTHPVEYKHGVTLPSFAGMLARHYLDTFDAPRESLGRIAVKNHRNGARNPKAQFRKEVDLETVLESPVVADPLRLYDFCPITDGSAALLLCPESRAEELVDEYTVITGVGGGSDTHVVHEREDITEMDAVVEAGRRAYEMAGRGPEDVDVAELHDMFTILECLLLEDLGFAEKGDGWRAAASGRTAPDGALPVNTSGGLKARGHPLGATGVAQVHELDRQLTGRAGERQVGGEVGLACNLGGFGNCATATILEGPAA